MTIDNNEQATKFSVEALARHEEFMSWMIEHWPQQSDPLTTADFAAGKREMSLLLGAKLHATGEAGPPISDSTESNSKDDEGQYLPVTPAPWP